jgi:hypothetical protein
LSHKDRLFTKNIGSQKIVKLRHQLILAKPNEVDPMELDIRGEQSNYKQEAPTVLKGL